MTDQTREYPTRPLVGIGIVVIRNTPEPGGVLLIQRAKPPAQGAWSLPGGAQHLGETAEAAARRELAEETGLSVGALTLAGHADNIHPDPDGRIRFHYTILDFCARWTEGNAAAGDDAAAVTWAALDRLQDYGLSPAAMHIIALSRALLDRADR